MQRYSGALIAFVAFVLLLVLRPARERLTNPSPVSKSIACSCSNYDSRLDQVETDVASLSKKVNDAVNEMKDSINSAADGIAQATQPKK